MNFDFTEEQSMIRESLSRFLRDKYDFDTRAKIAASEAGWSEEIWTQLAEMGIFAATFPEDLDGFGGTAIDNLVLMEELGNALVIEPFVPTVLLCGQLLRAENGAHAKALIPEIISGNLIMAFAHTEPRSRFNQSYVETTAKKDGSDYILSGRKTVVLAAPLADKFIISARTSGNKSDEKGISLFVVDANQERLNVDGYPTIDGLRAGEVNLDNVRVSQASLIGEEGSAYATIESVVDKAIIAISAESIGLCRKMCELTSEYCRTREQFGQPISKFQVLQHKMVDMFIHAEEMVSLAYMAAMKADTDEHDTRIAASAAKIQLGKSIKFIGENAIQLHGGMGITEEMTVGHYFMHATMLETMFGNSEYHFDRYENLSAKAP